MQPAAHPRSSESWFTSEWRSDAEIAAHLADLNDEQVRAVLSDHDGTFWRGHPNAPATFRAVLTKLMPQEQPGALLAESRRWIDGWQLPEETARRLWREAVGVVCTNADVALEEVASLIRGRSADDIHATLEAFVDARPAVSIEDARAQAEQFLVAAGLQMDETLKERVKSTVVSAWLIRAPEEALKLAAGTEAVAIREALHEPLRRLRALDPKAAARLLKMASEFQVYPEAVGETAFIAGFTPEEIRGAFEDAPQKTRLRYLDMYASRADEMAPDILVAMASLFSAEELVPEASGNGLSQYGPNAVIRALAERDPAACERWLAPLDATLRQELLGNVMDFPALFDAPFARFYLDRAERREEVTKHPYEFRQAMRTLGKADPELALSYLDRLPATHGAVAEREIRMHQFATLMRDDFDGAMAIAANAAEPLRENLLIVALSDRYSYDPQGAMQWAATSLEPKFQKMLEVHVTSTNFDVSGEEQYHRLVSLGAPESVIMWSVALFAQRSALSEPERAGALIKQLTNEETQAETAEILVSQWAEHDPAGAADWAATLPPGPTLDIVAEEIVKNIYAQPDDAIAWSAAISDPVTRDGVVEALIKKWAMNDPRVAERLAGDAPVSEAQRAKLLQMIANTPRARREAKGL